MTLRQYAKETSQYPFDDRLNVELGGNLKTLEKTRLGALLGAVALSIAMIFATAGAAAASPSYEVAGDDGPIHAQAWLPYDYAQITTEAKREARRAYLVKNVAWIINSNSDCWQYTRAQCLVSYYWMVVVFDPGSRVASFDPMKSDNKNVAAAAC